jgi:hypothetical protein
VVYPFLGNSTGIYPLLRDSSTGTVLVAEPGGSYDIEAAQGTGPVTVPPNDGLWGEPEADTPAARAKPSKTAKTAAPTAEETG